MYTKKNEFQVLWSNLFAEYFLNCSKISSKMFNNDAIKVSAYRMTLLAKIRCVICDDRHF